MRAIRLRSGDGLDRIKLEDVPDPGDPGPGEIRVRIHASSLNYHDYGVCSGVMPSDDGRIPLADGAGVVEAVGAGVDEFAEGDSVVSHFFPDWRDGEPFMAGFERTPGDGIDGYAQDYVVRPAHWFTHAPAEWTHMEAATITTAGLTAWRALMEVARVKPGDTILTMGTGGVSIYALQIAHAMGVDVISTSSTEDKLERLQDLGARHRINYKENESWGRTARDMTAGRGVDAVVEIGGPATLAQSIEATRIGGTIALIGVLTGIKGEVPTAHMMRKQIALSGLVVGSRQHQLDMVRAMEAMRIKPVVDRVFGLEDLADAFRHEESGQHFGKIGIELAAEN